MKENENELEFGYMEEDEMTVTLTLDDDSELECAVIAIFPVKDDNYIALLPMDDSNEGEVYLYRLNKNFKESLELENIEDDAEYEAVADAYDMLLDDAEFEDLMEEDEEEE